MTNSAITHRDDHRQDRNLASFLRPSQKFALTLFMAVIAVLPVRAAQTISIGPSGNIIPANIIHAANFSSIHTNGFGVSCGIGGTDTIDVQITNVPPGVTITPSTFGSFAPIDALSTATRTYPMNVAITNLTAGTYTLYVVASSTNTSITPKVQPFTITVATNRTFWVGTNNTTQAWSTAANWSPLSTLAGNDVTFEKMQLSFGNDTNFVDIGTNTVTANTTIGHLSYLAPIGTFWRTVISAGVTLTVTNGFSANSINTDNGGGTSHIFHLTMTGGNLLVTNYNKDFTLNNLDSASGGTPSGNILSFSLTGLSSMKAYVNRFAICDINAVTEGSIGAQNVRVDFPSMTVVAKYVGDYTQDEFTNSFEMSNHGDTPYQNGQPFTNSLGSATTIWADSFGVGRGGVQSALNGLYARSANSTLTLRNFDGVSRMSLVAIGVDSGNNSNGSGCRASLLFRNSTVDILADTLWLGRCRRVQNSHANAHVSGAIFANGGTINVNTAVLGYQVATNDNDCVGTIILTGGTLTVNNELTLGYSVGDRGFSDVVGAVGGGGQIGIVGASTSARFNKVSVGGPSKLSAKNFIGVTTGSLFLTNTMGSADGRVNTLGFTNGSLTLFLNGLDPRIYVQNLASSGNPTLNIAAITNIGSYPVQVPLISYQANTAGFTLGTLPASSPSYVAKLVTNVPNNSIDLLITAGKVQPGPVTWSGAASSAWDVQATTNWLNGATAYFYDNGVPVRFDDSASTGTVDLTTTLSPLSLVVSNTSLAYTFDSTGKLSGSTGLTKQGSGTLTLANTGGNDFTGGLTISGGTVQVGNADASGSVGSGNVTDNGALVFNRTDSIGLANNISGAGSLTQNGSGTLALSGAVSYSGATVVNAGTLELDGATGLGSSSSITVAAGATLNASTRTDGTLSLSSGQLLRGNGTIQGNVTAAAGSMVSPGTSVGRLTASGTVNLSGTTVIEIDKTALTNDVLQADTINIGGTLVVSNLSAAFTAGDSFHVFDANNYSGTVTSIVPATPGPGLVWDLSTLAFGTITVGIDIPVVNWTGAQDNLWDLTTTNWSDFGSPSTYSDGWTAVFDNNGANTSVDLTTSLSPFSVIVSNTIPYTFTGGGKITGSAKLSKYNSGTLIIDNTTANDFTGNLTIVGGTVQIGSGGANGTPGAGNIINDSALVFNRSGTLNVGNALSGSGSLTQSGSGTVALTGTVTYNGATHVGAGTLELDGSTSLASSPTLTVDAGATLKVSTRTDGTLTLVNGQALKGNGTVDGALVEGAGSTVSPGQSPGVLTASGAVTLGGTTTIEIDKTGGTNDLLAGSSMTYGGVLVVSNLSAALVDGDSFKVFDASTYAGAFTNIVPKRPGLGLQWDTGGLTDSGSLGVSIAPEIPATPPIKVDFSIAGRAEAIDPAFSEWVINDAVQMSNTFNGVTIVFTKVGPFGATIAGDWWKAGVDDFHCLMADDGLTVEGGDNGGQIEMRIRGLNPGPHSIATFHNTLGDPASNTNSPIDIFVNGVQVFTNFVCTSRVTNNYDAASAFMQVTAVEDEDVVILYKAVTNTSANVKNVTINGIEIDTVQSTLKAITPIPADLDEHFDADATKTVQLRWNPAASAVSNVVYFGTSSNAVVSATNSSAPEFMSLQVGTNFTVSNLNSLLTYYWRVDEISTNGVSKGDLWMFRIRHLAFPGAEGYGRFARGGRGGVVLEVTNILDYADNEPVIPGSLRWALNQNVADIGPRTVVFAVSGLIELKSGLTVGGDGSKTTIAGQTAPGKGIQIKKYPLGFSGGDDVIVRHMRSFPGKYSGNTVNGMGFGGVHNSIMDHCSSGWSLDECIPTRGAKNMTIQHTMISEPLNQAGHKNYPAGTRHGYASSTSGAIGSWHHDLLTHSEGRNWSLAGGLDGNGGYAGYLDIINNVVYNWDGRTTDGGVAELNFINNYYKVGPVNGTKSYFNVDRGTNADGHYGQIYYVAGNIMPGYPQSYSGGWITNQQMWPSYVTTQTASNAYKIVLSDVSATQPVLDDHDTRCINETITGTYTYNGSQTGLHGLPDSETDVGGWENYPEIHRDANFDTDHDGLPDWWENMKGLNPNSAPGDFSDSNADLVGDEYTELDRYLNYMAEPHKDCTGSFVDFDLSTLTKGFTASPVHSIVSTTNGSAVILGDGKTARFTPTASFAGLASLKFRVIDSMGDTMTNSVGFHVVANANTAPTLPAISDKTVNVGVTVTFTNLTTDTDVPAQTFLYSLPTAPSGALLDTNTGVFSWRPTVAFSSTANPVTIVVTDSGTPALSATQSFNINVNLLTQPSVGSVVKSANGQVTVNFTSQVGPDYAVLTSTNVALPLSSWSVLAITNAPPASWSFTDTASTNRQQFYRLKAGPPLP